MIIILIIVIFIQLIIIIFIIIVITIIMFIIICDEAGCRQVREQASGGVAGLAPDPNYSPR